jgi:hypothetical protein
MHRRELWRAGKYDNRYVLLIELCNQLGGVFAPSKVGINESHVRQMLRE